jgi:transposase
MTAEELTNKARKISSARLRARVQAIALLKKGWRQEAVAEAVGASVRSVQDWITRYNDGGIEELKEKPRSGAPPKLKDSVQFVERVLGGPDPQRDGSVTWTGIVLQRVLKKEFNAEYSLPGVYVVLRRFDLRWLSSRPQHPKSQPDVQEAFKKGVQGASTRSSS